MLPLDKDAAMRMMRSRWRVSVSHPTYPGTYVQDSRAETEEEAKAEVLAEFTRLHDRRGATAIAVAVHRERQ